MDYDLWSYTLDQSPHRGAAARTPSHDGAARAARTPSHDGAGSARSAGDQGQKRGREVAFGRQF